MKKSIVKGSIFVALGASSYGLLATFVKMAYREGFTTAEVTLSQFGLGFAGLCILVLIRKPESEARPKTTDIKSIIKLIAAGTSLGLTSIFYYMAVQYVPVSVGIVLLMQAVWMGVILESISHRKAPGPCKIVSVFIILAGTMLATNLLGQSTSLPWAGLGWGIMAALSYTASMHTSSRLELHFPPLKRSLYLILGGLIVISIVFHSSLNEAFSHAIFLRWGLLLSVFGTILPPLLLTRGIPLTGVGLGAIIAAVEIPVSVFMARLLLNEPVSYLQWVGVVLILCAVVGMNIGRSGPAQPASKYLNI